MRAGVRDMAQRFDAAAIRQNIESDAAGGFQHQGALRSFNVRAAGGCLMLPSQRKRGASDCALAAEYRRYSEATTTYCPLLVRRVVSKPLSLFAALQARRNRPRSMCNSSGSKDTTGRPHISSFEYSNNRCALSFHK
jgi:hypothetical protein